MTDPNDVQRAYFRAIEEAFIRLRGSPFLLSPADWRLAVGWHEQGIPVDVVLGALEVVFERRAERGEKGKVQSLRYCAAAVDGAWNARRELGAGQVAESGYRMDVAARLDRLAAALPDGLAGRARWAERIRGAGRDARSAEAALGELDAEMMSDHLDRLSEAERVELEDRVGAAVTRLAPALAVEVDDADRRRLLHEEARRRAGLPLLSLFSPDAV